MTTLQSGKSPGTRVLAGDSVAHAAKRTDTTRVAKQLAAFLAVHHRYAKAEETVKEVAEALQEQQARVGEADVAQDAAVLALAAALPGDGLPRLNPFKPFGAPPPAKLCALGYADEAQQVLALEKAVLKNKNLSSGTIAAAKAAGKAARAVERELAPIAKLQKARTDAITERDAVGQDWETAFAALKNSARVAEDQGARGLFAKLFDRKLVPKKPRASKAKKGSEAAPVDETKAANETREEPANETTPAEKQAAKAAPEQQTG